jgi:hypothetical protein
VVCVGGAGVPDLVIVQQLHIAGLQCHVHAHLQQMS